MLQLTTILFIFTFALLAFAHNAALSLHLYWQLPELDIPMHALGGVVAALGIFTLRDLRILPRRFLAPLPVTLILVVIVITWEIFELSIGVPIESDYLIDTAIDLCMGLSGGFVGYQLGKRIRG